MPLPEKIDRNKQVYLDKFGFRKLGDTKPSNLPKSYRELSVSTGLSIKRLQDIVNRYRDVYGPERSR